MVLEPGSINISNWGELEDDSGEHLMEILQRDLNNIIKILNEKSFSILLILDNAQDLIL